MSFHRDDQFQGCIQAPGWTVDVLKKYGQNPYGENILRVVFLPSRSYFIGGYWDQSDTLAYVRAPKYGVRERKWIMERWIPAASYGCPELWEAQTSTPEGYLGVGPFPVYGEYECAAKFSTGRGDEGYVPLEPGLIDLQARFIWQGRVATVWDIRNGMKSEEEAKAAHQDEKFEQMWADIHNSRPGITIGSGTSYNPDHAIEEYKERLVRNRHTWQSESKFKKGFSQE